MQGILNLPTQNNNPGDLRYAGQQGATEGKSNFASFSNPQQGYAALLNDVQAKINNHPDWNLVDFSKVYAPSSDNNNTAQYAANLANQLKVSPTTNIGSLQSRIGEFAGAIAQNEGYQGSAPQGNAGNGLGAFTPQPIAPYKTTETPYSAPANAATANQGGGFLSDLGQGNVGGALGDVFNFAFPVVSDIAKDISKGSVTGSGTLLKQLGDLGMTAAWLIPGLGELSVPARIGIRAGLGYLAGTAANLGAGESAGQAITPNLSNLAGAATAGLLPEAIKGIGAAREALAGISPQTKTILQEAGTDPQLAQEYLNTTAAHAKDIRQPTALTKAADQLDQARQIIDQKVAAAGKEVGAAKTALNNTKIGFNIGESQGAQDFLNQVEDKYGITMDKNGNVSTLPGRSPSLSTAEIKRLADAYTRMANLDENSSGRQLTDAIESISKGIKEAKSSNLQKYDPLSAILTGAKNGLNQALRYLSPSMADANDAFSAVKDIQNEMNQMAGRENQRGTLLLKRVFSGDKQGEVQDLFQKIKNITGIDLTKHAVLAAHAISVAGDKSERGLLEQAIQQAIQEGGAPSLPGIAINAGKKIALKTVANPYKITAALAGKTPGFIPRALSRSVVPAAVRGIIALPQKQSNNP